MIATLIELAIVVVLWQWSKPVAVIIFAIVVLDFAKKYRQEKRNVRADT